MIRCASLILVAFLASCTAGPQRPRIPQAQIERALATAPGAAQPGRIVAAETGFAKMAREEGQWTAFRAYAAPGGFLLAESGVLEAASWLKSRADPAKAVQWAPRTVWMSCDGALAVSQGRFAEPDGTVGTYVTLWQRQENGDYRYLFDAGSADNPQPVRKTDGEALPGEIVVTGLDSIKGLVADCTRRDETPPPVPAALAQARAGANVRTSPDGTLSFHWSRLPSGERHIETWWLENGSWQQAMSIDWPPSRAG